MSSASEATAAAVTFDADRIYRVDDTLFLAPQLSDEHLKDLIKHHGISSVVNLRHSSEATFALPAKHVTEGAGLTYIHVPMPGSQMRDETSMDRALAEIDRAPKPVLVHCAGMVRAAAVGLLFSATRGRVSTDELVVQAHSAGKSPAASSALPPPLLEFIKQYNEGKLALVKSLPGFEIVSDDLIVGPQFSESQIEDLKKLRVRSVLNIRDPSEESGSLGLGVLAREKDLVEASGMAYRNIPTKWTKLQDRLTPIEIDAVVAAYDSMEKPVLIHDRTMKRVLNVLEVLEARLAPEQEQ